MALILMLPFFRNEVTNPERRDYDPQVSRKNRRGEWVPAIPLPLMLLRNRCECGKRFWTLKGYLGHYALEHILGYD